jgi:hypothetical protein
MNISFSKGQCIFGYTLDAIIRVRSMNYWCCPYCKNDLIVETFLAFNFNHSEDARKVFLLVDNVIRGSRKNGTAAMTQEMHKKILYSFEI